jgi:hypothetical protein
MKGDCSGGPQAGLYRLLSLDLCRRGIFDMNLQDGAL